MSEIDEHSRTLRDHEKRLNRIEAWMEAQRKPQCWRCAGTGKITSVGTNFVSVRTCEDCSGQGRGSQFCSCGRDVCRAPDCPSHKDPMGR